MTERAACPRCGNQWPDEYTHSDCPTGSTPEGHRHWVCANAKCEHEWVEHSSRCCHVGRRWLMPEVGDRVRIAPTKVGQAQRDGVVTGVTDDC